MGADQRPGDNPGTNPSGGTRLAPRSNIGWSVRTAQGAFYLLTGLWPVLHLKSFMKVTGPKEEEWLVKSVGLLTASIGAALMAGGSHKQADGQQALLGLLTAVSLAGIDLVYTGKGRLRPVYLLDGLAQLLFAASWVLRWRSSRPSLSEGLSGQV